jgi:hypothetical protein
MPQQYTDAVRAAIEAGRAEWTPIQKWVERFVCGTNTAQNIVGNRDHPDGGKITQTQFDAGDKVAHVCPFVKDSIEQGLFYIESSPLTNLNEIRKLLAQRREEFKQYEPAFDPLAQGRGAPMPHGIKTLLLFFPNYQCPRSGGADAGVDQMYRWLIMSFMRQGLMLGQFYRGCTEPGCHNPNWKKALTCPYLAFVFRYMQPHDKVFIWPESPGWPIYQRLFPDHAAHAAPAAAALPGVT